MDPEALADEIALQMRGCPRAVFYILLEAIEQLGGELRVDPEKYLRIVKEIPPGIDVDTGDGPIVFRATPRA